MYAQCPHELFVRALPWKCRSPDVDLHPYASRTDVSRASRKQAAKPVSKAKARSNARALTLAEFFPSRKHAKAAGKEHGERPEVQLDVPTRPPLKKFRRLKDWDGDWVRCDLCNAWQKVTHAEVEALKHRSFVCADIGVACKHG